MKIGYSQALSFTSGAAADLQTLAAGADAGTEVKMDETNNTAYLDQLTNNPANTYGKLSLLDVPGRTVNVYVPVDPIEASTTGQVSQDDVENAAKGDKIILEESGDLSQTKYAFIGYPQPMVPESAK
jgi:hypothetical protein